MNKPIVRVKTKIDCAGHQHDLCVVVDRGLPEELRCPHQSHGGFGGGPGGCTLPDHLEERVARELRENFQESKRRGYVLIRS